MHSIKDIYNGKYDNYILPLFWQEEGGDDIVVEYIHLMKKADIHAFCLESRTFEDFCGPKWWERMNLVISTAKELGMRVWLLDDKHFPTGYANGYIQTKYPEMGKKVLAHRNIDIWGPQKNAGYYTQALDDDTAVLYGVVARSGNRVINLTNYVDDSGILYYDFPKGRWTITFLYISRQTASSANYSSEYYINMVDRESCALMIEAVYQPHYEHFAGEFGKTFAGFFSDEPGFMNEPPNKGYSPIGKDMPLPWSTQVESLLEEKLGKEYLLALPELWTDIGESTVQIRYCYMDIVTQLYKENFSNSLGDWCRDHGCEYIGHVIEERHSNARLGCGSGNMFRAMAGKDMAGLDIIFNQLIPGCDENHSWNRGEWDGEFFHYALGKIGSSLAQIDPKKKGRSMVEIYGAYGWHEGIRLMKWLTDYFLSRGVNHYSPHAFSPKAFPDPDCPPHMFAGGNDMQFRYFPILMRYINRMCNLLSDGVIKPTAAILFNIESEWTGDYMLPQKPAKILTQNQIDFTFLCNDVFLTPDEFNADLSNGLSVNGMNYKVLILPYCQYISKELARFIVSAKGTNLKIVCLEKLPRGLYNSTDIEILKQMEHVEVVSLDQLSDYMFKNSFYNIRVKKQQKFLRYYHYFKEKQEYIMLFNEGSTETIRTEIEYETNQPCYCYDVLHNRLTKLDDFNLELAPSESLVIVVGEVDADLVSAAQPNFTQSLELNWDYNVSIASVAEYPVFRSYKHISAPINFARSEYLPKFSGTFRYETTLELKDSLEEAVIDLGDVYDVAEVFINGTSVGANFCPPYIFAVKGLLKKGKNKIAIDVTNALDKQIPENLSITEPRRPSGLMDPVHLFY